MTANLFSLIMEHDPNLIFVKDENSIILYANKSFLEMYSPEKRDTIVGTTTIEEFSAEEASLWLSEDRRALSLGLTEIIENITDYKGLNRFFLTRKIAYTSEEGKPRLLGICTDITELADREKHLSEAYKRLENYSSFAAHDLRSPLVTFVSILELVRLDKANVLSPQSSAYINMMLNSVHGLAKQVTATLTAAKAINADEIYYQNTDLNILLEDVKFNISEYLRNNDATLHTVRLPHLKVEPQLFRQLLQNLIENAIRHRSGKPPMVFIRYKETVAEHIIFVEDNGRGIAVDDRQKVFDAFAQGSDVKNGTGIGLALCRRVIELHQGSISVDPTFQDGCCIVLKFPKVIKLAA